MLRSLGLPEFIVLSPLILLLVIYFLNKAWVKWRKARGTSSPSLPANAREPKSGFIVEAAELERRYATLSERDLATLWSGDLTGVARECAERELSRRGNPPVEAECLPIDPASVVTLNISKGLIKAHNQASVQLGLFGIVLLCVGPWLQNRLVSFLGLTLFIGAVAYYAKAKGRSPAWSLLSFVLTPIGAVVVIACLGISPSYTCSGCGWVNSYGGRNCSGCGKIILGSSLESSSGKMIGQSYRCPLCKAAVLANVRICPECNSLLKV